MKIEIGESLACSWLRHVCQCWLVQANWKVSEHWERYPTNAELEELFRTMRDRFDRGSVFKKTKDAEQFLKQGEIDVVGIDREGDVHAAEVAFHEAGLQYGNTAQTNDRVLKKMLRTLLILWAFRPPETRLHIYFLSPKVNCAVQRPLKETFADLAAAYPDVEWEFFANDDFAETIVRPTLEKASAVADSSELLVRSVKLLELAGYGAGLRSSVRGIGSSAEPDSATAKIQPLVKDLMQTLLEKVPGLLSDECKHGLQDKEYCNKLGLTIGYPLLRRTGVGTADDKGHMRYWAKKYCDFYVCNDWKPQRHRSNASSLLRFIQDVVERNKGRPEADALRPHERAFQDYLNIT